MDSRAHVLETKAMATKSKRCARLTHATRQHIRLLAARPMSNPNKLPRAVYAVAVLFATLTSSPRAHAAPFFQTTFDGDDRYSETFTAIADMKDGTYIQLQLNVSNYGAGENKAACRILVVPNEGKPFTATNRVDKEEWSFSGETMKVKECSMTAGATPTIIGKLDGGNVKLTFASPIQVREPPDSKLTMENRTFNYWIGIAWSAVEASIDTGAGAKVSSGYGYLDHSRSTTKPDELANRWIRFRAENADDSWLLLARNMPDGGLRGWSWRQKEPFARPLKRMKATRVDEKDQAKGYRIEGESGGGTFTIVVDKQLYRFAPVEEYGMLGMMARAVVGNPVTRTYRATLTLTENGQTSEPKQGILEVQHVQ